jgi:isopentenyl diphosphate isomerase/L-lactate dehydrogenase-like FMN-dependent dehydrogenase
VTQVSDQPLITVADFRRRARISLPRMAWDYFRSGADAQLTLKRNRAAFRRVELWYHVLRDVSVRDLRTTVLGTEVSFPVLVAPTAYHKLAHPDGEIGTAQAAAEAGTLFICSTLATTRLEEVAAASSGPRWFQLYVHKDRGLTRSLCERAEAAGYRALVLTVDAPLLGRRLADERNRFALPPPLTMANLVSEGAPVEATGSMLAGYFAARHDPSLTWSDLAWLKTCTRLPLVLKGIVRPDDAVRAVGEGAAALVVSNHGGRQLDGSPATLDALPLIWGLAVGGRAGVLQVLTLLREELSVAMALAGCASLAEIGRDLVGVL